VRVADERRAALTPGAELPEVPDPWGRPREAYGEIAATVADLCRRLVAGLFGMARPA
jgi:protein-tyrosine-phosphatase